MNRAVLTIGGVALLGVAAWVLFREEPRNEAPPAATEPATDPRPETAPAVPAVESGVPDPVPLTEGLPPEFYRQLAPGEEVALTVPPGLTSGIRCPDGSHLPLLNGVPHAGPIKRGRFSGPWSPVVAKMREADGIEWYVHADGSKTTTRWVDVTVEGVPGKKIATYHISPQDPDGTHLLERPDGNSAPLESTKR